jgi:hypothetical protein
VKKYWVSFVKFEICIIKICSNSKIAFAENGIHPTQPPQPLRDISNYYQQSGSLNNMEEGLLARFVSSEINNTQSTLEFFF